MRTRRAVSAQVLVAAMSAAVVTVDAPPAAAHERPPTTLVSADSAGVAGNRTSRPVSATRDGRFVAFESDADNLAPGGTSVPGQVFLRDRRTGTTHGVAVSTDGVQANRPSWNAVVSREGRYVAFQSLATNLVVNDDAAADDHFDVFVRDRQAGTTIQATVGRGGENSDGHSFQPSLSADGRYLAFDSEAANLVADDTNGRLDVFVRDLRAGVTTRVSVRGDGSQLGAGGLLAQLSGDGRVVVFSSAAGDLVPGDANGRPDLFVKDLRSGRVELVSRTPTGAPFPGNHLFHQVSVSADGARVAFAVGPPGLGAQVYLWDRARGTTTLISAGQDGQPSEAGATRPSISGNGRYVAFETWSPDVPPEVLPPATRIVVRDLATGRNFVGSLDSRGRPVPFQSGDPVVTDVGVAFFSMVADVVPGVPVLGPMPPPPNPPVPIPGQPLPPLPPRPAPGLMATVGQVYFHEF